jgi:hypothetical protein
VLQEKVIEPNKNSKLIATATPNQTMATQIFRTTSSMEAMALYNNIREGFQRNSSPRLAGIHLLQHPGHVLMLVTMTP